MAIDDYNVHVVSVPAGTTYTRFSLFDANSTADSDLDLEVYNSAFTFIGGSGGATSAEEEDRRDPQSALADAQPPQRKTDGGDRK